MKRHPALETRTRLMACFLALGPLAGCGDASGSPAPEGGPGGGGASSSAEGGSGGHGGSSAADALPACPPDGAEPPHTDLVAGVYSVPVPPELEPYASYPVDDVGLCRTTGGIHLGYTLPALLVGKGNHVSFEGAFDAAKGAFALAGSEGTASCVPATEWSCSEVFTGIEVDLDAVTKQSEGLGAAEAAARLEVAKQFSVDPIGKLVFAAP